MHTYYTTRDTISQESKENTCTVEVEFQGRLVRTRVRYRRQGRAGGGRRGAIHQFSRASRRRLMQLLARLQFQGAIFITLTFPGDGAALPSPAQAKAALFSFLKRLERRYPAMSCVWRFEWESKGRREYNPHFHLLVFGVEFIPKEEVTKLWEEVLGVKAPWATRIERVRSFRGVMSYAAKYLGKAGLVYDAYLSERYGALGRVWGAWGRRRLPFAPLVVARVAWGRWFWDWKRYARRYYRHILSGVAGFFLLVACTGRWVRLLLAVT